VEVRNLTDVSAISASHGAVALAVLRNGTVRAWGQNVFGQLGDNSNVNSDVPVEVLQLHEITAVAAGYEHSLALQSNGSVYGWGENSYGQIGEIKHSCCYSWVPELNQDLYNRLAYMPGVTVSSIAAGGFFSMALLSNGTVMAWGEDSLGQLGDNATANTPLPTAADLSSPMTAIAAGDTFSLSGALLPTLTKVAPRTGLDSGGTSVTITGTNLAATKAVKFGSAQAPSFEVLPQNTIKAVSPPGTGTVDVTVETAGGTSATTAADQFTYSPAYSMDIELGALAGLPTDVAANSEGDVWVSSWERGTVKEINEKGESLRAVGALESPCSGSLEGPYGLALDTTGDLWVTDLIDGYVRKFSAEGKCLLQVYVGGRPRGITLDARGNVWVSGTAAGCLQELSSEGVSERAVGCSLGGTYTFPGGVAIDPHGHIWLADIANSRVIELGEAGEYLGQLGTTTSCGPVLCLPMAVAADANGNILVANASHIDQFSEGGELLSQVGGFGSGTGQMEFPMGLAVDSKGSLWVADTGNGRVQKWSGG
jgi:streptogramin lyase